MPYNTRRKSLSLPSLGIHLPVTHASRAAARSPPSTTPPTDQPPVKKIKRSHSSNSPTPMSPPPKREVAQKTVVKYEHTPPPSPEAEELEDGLEESVKIDMDSINDDIVSGVIRQLQTTANRPHLVKELAAILTNSVKIVETSANPSAIISSRLSTYLKRPCWSASAPCPLAKELETVHPRRTYFYLTTCPHQPIPDPAQASVAAEVLRYQQRSIISPSLSSATSRSDEAEAERRRELSPSPEIDLSAPDFDSMDIDDGMVTPPTPTGSFSGRLTIGEKGMSSNSMRNNRAASPPLEKDEKEFTQTARGMQKRKLSHAKELQVFVQPSLAVPEVDASKHMDLDGDLFGYRAMPTLVQSTVYVSSPAFKPTLAVNTLPMKKNLDEMNVDMWSRDCEWDTRSPENIELHELDDLFDQF